MTDRATARRAGARSLASLLLIAAGLLAGFLMQVLAARQLGPQSYGVFGLVQASLIVLASIVPLGWLEGIPKFVAEYVESANTARLWGVALRSQRATLAASMVVSLLLATFALGLEPGSTSSSLFLGIALLLPGYTLIRVQQQILLTLQRLVDGLLFVHLVVPLTVLLGMFTWPDFGLFELLGLYWGGTILALVGQSLRLRQALPARTTPEYLTRHWHSVTSRLVAGVLAQRLMAQADMMLLAPFAGLTEVGVYSLARRLSDVVAMANQVLATSLAPMLGRALVAGRRAEARRLLAFANLSSTLWGAPFLLGALLFPGPILGLFGADYASGALVLQILMLGVFLNVASGPVGATLLVAGHEEFWRRSSLISTFVGLAGYLLAAPLLGAVGVALVKMTYNAALNLARWHYLWRLVRA